MSEQEKNELLAMTQLLKPKAPAQQLAIGLRTLERLAAANEIPAVRIGRSLRFDPADLARYVASCKSKARLDLATSA